MELSKTNLVAQIKSNQRIIGRLMTLFNKSSFTINRWIDERDIRLTTPAAVQIIREETGLSNKDILEGVAA